MTDVRVTLPAGSLIRRKQPENDGWDVLRVIGHADFAIEGGGSETEVVVQPEGGHESPIHVALEALDAHYLLVDEGKWPPNDWASDPIDVLLRRDSTVTDPGGVARIIADDRKESGPPSPRVAKWAAEHDPDPLADKLNELED
jgi:hypothetical protein